MKSQVHNGNVWYPTERAVRNSLTALRYRMVPAQEVTPSKEQLINVVEICNQEAIYASLFEERLAGKPYELVDAQGFLDWAARGWTEQTHFVFFLVDPSGLISGAVDIKSADREMAEIGFWCSLLHAGLMTQAVEQLRVLAVEVGYKELFACVRNDNIASLKVLKRNGFISRGCMPGVVNRTRFELVLS